MTPRVRTLSDRQINQYATFLPYTPPEADNGAEAMPGIVLAGDENGDGGVQVYAYAENGQLIISVHYDTAGPDEDGDGPWAYYGPRNAIPVIILGGSGEPVWQATAEVNPDARPHAPATPGALRSWIGTLTSPPTRRPASNTTARPTPRHAHGVNEPEDYAEYCTEDCAENGE